MANAFDDMTPFTNESLISKTKKESWKDFDLNAQYVIPPIVNKPKVKAVKVLVCVDSYLAINLLHQHSHTCKYILTTIQFCGLVSTRIQLRLQYVDLNFSLWKLQRK